VTRTVLSIEDTHGIRRLIRMTLEYDGFTVLEAANGHEGMELARRNRPALILMDVKMPGLNGIEVCKALRADPALSRVPVVMLSTADSDEDIQAGLRAGASTYLTKPFMPLDLIQLVNTLIEEAAN
jgi:DNA-binding response OmpR family regulator